MKPPTSHILWVYTGRQCMVWRKTKLIHIRLHIKSVLVKMDVQYPHWGIDKGPWHNARTMSQTATTPAVLTVSTCTQLLRSMAWARPDPPTSTNFGTGESGCASATTSRDSKAARCGLSPKLLPLILPDEMSPPLPLSDPPIPNPLLCAGLMGRLMLGGECGGEGEVRNILRNGEHRTNGCGEMNMKDAAGYRVLTSA